MTSAQCRAARGMLGWSQHKLATRAQVGIVTVRAFERGTTQPRNATIAAMQRALEAAGVEFTNGDEPGIKAKKQET